MNVKLLTHFATRVFGSVLAIQPSKFEVIVSAIGDRLGLEIDAEGIAARNATSVQPSAPTITPEGIAIIPIEGTLVKKASGMAAMSGLTTYDALSQQFADAVNNPAVTGIVFDCSSPGGEVSGMIPLADQIFAARGFKPIYAVANDGAFSAAYALASAADKIYVTQTGGVGSIGVFTAHLDQSKADEKSGLKYTYIKAGEKKTAGNPHEPLSDDAQADLQDEVDRIYGMFCQMVARNRKASLAQVTGTEAGCYFGERAVPLLADKVGSLQDALADIGVAINRNANMPISTTTIAALTEEETMELTALMEQLAALQAQVLALTAAKASDKSDDKKDDKVACDDKADVKDDDEDDDEEDKKDDKEAKASVRIANLCALAGMPELTAGFLTEGASVSAVEKALLTKRASKSKAIETPASTTSPVGFAAAYNAIESDRSITNKAEAFGKYLVAHPTEYATYVSQRGN